MAIIISYIIIPLLFNDCYGKACSLYQIYGGVGATCVTFEVILSLLDHYRIRQCPLLTAITDHFKALGIKLCVRGVSAFHLLVPIL